MIADPLAVVAEDQLIWPRSTIVHVVAWSRAYRARFALVVLVDDVPITAWMVVLVAVWFSRGDRSPKPIPNPSNQLMITHDVIHVRVKTDALLFSSNVPMTSPQCPR